MQHLEVLLVNLKTTNFMEKLEKSKYTSYDKHKNLTKILKKSQMINNRKFLIECQNESLKLDDIKEK